MFQKDHGYVFEVDPFDRAENLDPVPLKFLGRYVHEAVVVDPHTSVIYLTEDAGNPNGLWFRWVPPRHFKGRKGGLRDLARPPRRVALPRKIREVAWQSPFRRISNGGIARQLPGSWGAARRGRSWGAARG